MLVVLLQHSSHVHPQVVVEQVVLEETHQVQQAVLAA
jgi:hypothetical protein